MHKMAAGLIVVFCAACGDTCRSTTALTSGPADAGATVGAPDAAASARHPQPSAAHETPGFDAASPSASAADVAPWPTDCVIHLQQVKFVECNPRPTQRNYPECWTYYIEPIDRRPEDREGCLPRYVVVAIAGWQSIADRLRAKVGYDSARPNEITLTLESVESTLLGFDAKPGSVLGTLLFKDGRGSELRFGAGMPSQTHSRSLRAEPAR